MQATLEMKTGWALRSPHLVHPALASLIYSGGEAAEPHRRTSQTT